MGKMFDGPWNYGFVDQSKEELYEEYIEKNNKKIAEEKAILRKVENKLKAEKGLINAGLIAAGILMFSGASLGTGKLFKLYPFESQKEVYEIVKEEVSSDGDSLITVVNESDDYWKSENARRANVSFKVYDSWNEEDGMYKRTETTYSTSKLCDAEAYREELRNNISTLTEQDIIDMEYTRGPVHVQEVNNLTEEELNKDPYIVMETNYGRLAYFKEKKTSDKIFNIITMLVAGLGPVAAEALIVNETRKKKKNSNENLTEEEIKSLTYIHELEKDNEYYQDKINRIKASRGYINYNEIDADHAEIIKAFLGRVKGER